MQISKLHLHSYGIVAANKKRSSMEIEVTPIEETPMVDGELTDAATQEKAKGINAEGAAFEASVVTAASISARWLPFGSNRATAPDVRRGEKVAIYRFADADKYYWTELEYDAKLRKLETVIFTFSNTQVESEDATPETTYYLEVSTHDKVIRLHTSTSDGEPYGYDFVLNTKEGNFTITDTIDNRITLDSAAHQIVGINATGSFIEIIKENINIYAVKDINMIAGQDFNTVIGRNRNTTVHGTENKAVTETMNASVKGSINYQTPDSMNIMTPSVNASANVTTGKAVLVGSGISTGMVAGAGGGGSTINGSLSITGYLESSAGASFAGSVDAPNIR